MKTPMISVIMPVYNGEKYLREAIESILNQTYTDFEFIILNDGSTDRTEEIILSYDDPRIVYVKNKKNLQIVETLNKGIALARGKYIARMDADDISLPERLEKQIKFMKDNPDVDVCGTWIRTFGREDKEWKYPVTHVEIKARLLLNCALAHPSVMMKKIVFDKFKYRKSYEKAEDYDLWVEIVDDFSLYNLPNFLLRYRLHGEQTDKATQEKITNVIRSNMLKKIGCTLREEELDTFYDIAKYRNVNMDDAEKVLLKIIKSNKKSKFIKEDELEKMAAEVYWSVLNRQNIYTLALLRNYIKSQLRGRTSSSVMGQAKFLMKCLIGYKS